MMAKEGEWPDSLGGTSESVVKFEMRGHEKHPDSVLAEIWRFTISLESDDHVID